MSLPFLQTDSPNERAHRSLIATVVNQLIKVRPPNDLTPAEIAAGVTPSDVRYAPYHVLRYGADPTGATDSTDAIQAAVDAAEATSGYNHTVTLPHGTLRIDGTITCTQGTMIVGHGSQGSTLGYGTSIDHRSAGDCFVWNPQNGASNAGTGGGLKNVVIVKASGVSGGRAIYVVNFDNNHRCGEMVFENILIYGTGTGMWSKGVFLDGSLTNTPGARGVRSVSFSKVRVATCSSNNQYVHITQGTHIYGSLAIDNAGGSGTTGMTIDGFWDNIHLDLRIGGNIVINHDGSVGVDFPALTLAGVCDSLDINYQSVIGNVDMVVGSSLTSNSKGLRISSNHADAFAAYKSATTTNVTGNGTTYTIIPDTELYDKNASYDNSTGIFTAKCAGLYDFKAGVLLVGLSASHTTAAFNLIHRDSGATLINNVEHIVSPGAIRSAANQATVVHHATLDLSEGDTVRLQITVSGAGSDDADIGGASTRYTYLMGKLLP